MVSSPRQERTLLEQLIHEREATYEEQVNAFLKLAVQLNEPATMSVRHLQRLAAGERGQRSTPSTRRLLRQLYGYPLDELLGPPHPTRPPSTTATAAPSGDDVAEIDVDGRATSSPNDSPRPMSTDLVLTAPRELTRSAEPDPPPATADAASTSLEFASWVDANQLSPSIVEHVTYELARIAVDYVSTPALPLLKDLVRVRDTMFGLLRDRPNPRQSRELFFLAGTTCLLLAHATQNLGDPSSAMAQARTALTCAEQADHDALRAWVHGTQALIAEWTRQPARAIQFARAGQAFASTPDSQVRLSAIEARTQARAGNIPAAVVALERAQHFGQQPVRSDDLTDFGGLLTFPAAKQRYYAGSTLALIGEHSQAESAALEAIGMYESGPFEQRSYGDEALARVDVASARMAAGDVEGTAAALEPVLALPPEQRIRQLHDGLARVRSGLILPRYGKAHAAVELVGQITDFSSRSAAGDRALGSVGAHPSR